MKYYLVFISTSDRNWLHTTSHMRLFFFSAQSFATGTLKLAIIHARAIIIIIIEVYTVGQFIQSHLLHLKLVFYQNFFQILNKYWTSIIHGSGICDISGDSFPLTFSLLSTKSNTTLDMNTRLKTLMKMKLAICFCFQEQRQRQDEVEMQREKQRASAVRQARMQVMKPG